MFIEALIKGLEREIIDNFIKDYGKEEMMEAIGRKEKINVYNIVEGPRGKGEGLIKKLGIKENKVTDSMRSMDLLFQKFDDNIYDFVLLNLNSYVPMKLAITEWVYDQGKYDIRFGTKNDVYVKTIPGSSVSRIASKNIIIQEIEKL